MLNCQENSDNEDGFQIEHVTATSAAHRTHLTPPADGFVSLMGRLTPFLSNTTVALAEDGASLGSRQLDLGIPG